MATIVHDALPKAPIAFLSSDLAGLKLLHRGKVRDVYEVDEKSVLFVATDRISAFDVVLKNGIPGKGKILTQMSLFWFRLLKEEDVGPNHLITGNIDEMPEAVKQHRNVLHGRVMLVHKLQMMPVECVVRGYLTGGGWKDYQQKGSVCGVQLPANLKDCQKLPEPIYTPSTKAEIGLHDENITFEQAKKLVGDRIEVLRARTMKLYELASAYALTKGIIIADTKFEFGIDSLGRIVLADEVFTPDCSRFWDVTKYVVGRPQDSLDKQVVRDYLESIHFDKKTPIELPESVVMETLKRYTQIFELLTASSPDL